MGKFINLRGRRFGRLVVMERAPKCGLSTLWHVRCSCGIRKVVRAGDLTRAGGENGRTKWSPVRSCGRHRTGKNNGSYKHGGTLPKLKKTYDSWMAMQQRCYNPKNVSYEHYHDKGITVCERWRDEKDGFQNFLSDLGRRPKGKTLDRINVLGNYEPGNCRWADKSTQTQNRACMKTPEELVELQRQADELAAFNAEMDPY
jgi:hypothetical protein